MSLTATVGKERDLIEEGIFDGVCSKIIDLGTQYSETFKNSAHKIRIFWEIVGETSHEKVTNSGKNDPPRDAGGRNPHATASQPATSHFCANAGDAPPGRK